MFDKLLLTKFPELSTDDIAEIRQAIAGEVNQTKSAVVDNSTLLKQLQDDNTNLKAELAAVTEQLSKVQALVIAPAEDQQPQYVTPDAAQTIA
ncbi:cell shape-determining protein MreC [Clostridium beijerinckii]|nr:cell shape-determining protein MreC [Clostridium beijerinckii]